MEVSKKSGALAALGFDNPVDRLSISLGYAVINCGDETAGVSLQQFVRSVQLSGKELDLDRYYRVVGSSKESLYCDDYLVKEEARASLRQYLLAGEMARWLCEHQYWSSAAVRDASSVIAVHLGAGLYAIPRSADGHQLGLLLFGWMTGAGIDALGADCAAPLHPSRWKEGPHLVIRVALLRSEDIDRFIGNSFQEFNGKVFHIEYCRGGAMKLAAWPSKAGDPSAEEFRSDRR